MSYSQSSDDLKLHFAIFLPKKEENEPLHESINMASQLQSPGSWEWFLDESQLRDCENTLLPPPNLG